MTESATGEVHNSSVVVPTSVTPFSLDLEAPASFKPGLPWEVQLTATYPDGTPRDGTYVVNISAPFPNGTSALPGVPTVIMIASGGRATASVTVPKPSAACCNATLGFGAKGTECCVNSVNAFFSNTDNVYASAYASAASSPAAEFVSLGKQSPAGPAAAGATVSFPVATTVAGGTPVSFVLVGSQGVAASGVVSAGSSGGSISFTLPSGLGSQANLLAFIQTATGVAADSVPVSFVPSMPLTVSARFNQTAAQPGDPVSIAASASGGAGSRVWLLVTDKSVALLGGSSALNGSTLLAKVAEATSAASDRQEEMFGMSINRCWGMLTPQAAAGVAFFTPLPVPKCSSSGWGGGGVAMDMMAMGAVAEAAPASADRSRQPAAAGEAAATPTTRLRTLFPETWVWTSAAVDASGAATVALTAPDTITSWQLTAFASGAGGLGVAPAAPELSVSQPFYIRPALPYSLVRNETLTVKVGVFSALPAAISATVTLAGGSGAFSGAGSVTVSVPAGGSATATFLITPSALGPLTLTFAAASSDGAASDAVQKTLVVFAEGFPVTVTQNAVVNGTSGAITFASSLPADLVPGSAATTISVVGDLMGNTIKGLDKLVSVPSGCARPGRRPLLCPRAELSRAALLARAGRIVAVEWV